MLTVVILDGARNNQVIEAKVIKGTRFSVERVKHGNRLPREAEGSLSLESSRIGWTPTCAGLPGSIRSYLSAGGKAVDQVFS